MQENNLHVVLADSKETDPQNFNNSKFLLTEDESIKYVENIKTEIQNVLVGKLSLSGEYKIEEALLKELIAVNKVIEEDFDGKYILSCKNKLDERLSLKFSLMVIEKGDKKAGSLFLLEKIFNEVAFATIKSTLIATYTDENDGAFDEKVKKVFNIKPKPEGDGVEYMDENLVILLLAKKRKLLLSGGNLQGGAELIEENYFQAMIEMLKKSGKYGEFVLNRFLQSKDNQGLKKGVTKNYYQKMVKCLLKEIELAGPVNMPAELKRQMLALSKTRQKDYEMLKDYTPKTANATKPKPTEKEKPASGGSSKPKAKSGSPKKLDVKKAKVEDKKKGKVYGKIIPVERPKVKVETGPKKEPVKAEKSFVDSVIGEAAIKERVDFSERILHKTLTCEPSGIPVEEATSKKIKDVVVPGAETSGGHLGKSKGKTSFEIGGK